MKLFLSLIIILAILVLAFSYYAYRMSCYMPKRLKDDEYTLPPGMTMENMNPGIRKSMDRMLAVPFEPVTITSFDGKKLFGRYYHVADGAPVQIQFHGYKGSPFVDMSGGNDHFVPCQMSREIVNACASPVTLVTIPGAGHGRSYLTDPKRYEKEVRTFANNLPK